MLLILACYRIFDSEVILKQNKNHFVYLNIKKNKCLGILFSSKLQILIHILSNLTTTCCHLDK